MSTRRPNIEGGNRFGVRRKDAIFPVSKTYVGSKRVSERRQGIDQNDAAAQWLRENDPQRRR